MPLMSWLVGMSLQGDRFATACAIANLDTECQRLGWGIGEFERVMVKAEALVRRTPMSLLQVINTEVKPALARGASVTEVLGQLESVGPRGLST